MLPSIPPSSKTRPSKPPSTGPPTTPTPTPPKLLLATPPPLPPAQKQLQSLTEESAILSYHTRITSHLAILTFRPTSHILLSVDHHYDKNDSLKSWCVVSALLLHDPSHSTRHGGEYGLEEKAEEKPHTLLLRYEAKSEMLTEQGGMNSPGYVLRALKDVYRALNKPLVEKMRKVKKEETPRFVMEKVRGKKGSYVDSVGREEDTGARAV